LESVGAIETEGTSLHFVSIGRGTPIIVVSGGPGLGHYYLRPGMDALAEEGHRVIYYDQRGSGRSEPGDSATGTLAEAIADLDAVRRGIGIERANLLGHSFGADMAVLYAAQHPENVASLVLANPGPPFHRELQEALGAEMQRRTRPEDAEKLEVLTKSAEFASRKPKATEEFIRIVYVPFFRDPAFAESIDFAFSELSAQSAVGSEEMWMEEFEPLDAIGSVDRVKAPTLVVHSELDPIPLEFSKFLAEAISGSEFHLAQGAGHFAYAEDPDALIPAILDFLRRNAR
jgi:proline iminopeptidase